MSLVCKGGVLLTEKNITFVLFYSVIVKIYLALDQTNIALLKKHSGFTRLENISAQKQFGRRNQGLCGSVPRQ